MSVGRKIKFTLKWIVILVFIVVLFYYLWLLFYLTCVARTEAIKKDDYLNTLINKRALIITAHTDDDVGMAGTLLQLAKNGWQLKHVIFNNEDQTDIKERFANACKQIQVNETGVFAVNIRRDLDTNKKAYWPLPFAVWDKVFDHDTVYSILSKEILDYKPSVIFTLDDSIGGYGHPEHVLISKVVHEICTNYKNEEIYKGGTLFSVEKIYQAVLPKKMAHKLLVDGSRVQKSANVYLAAQAAYSCSGMPDPEVEVEIKGLSKEKMNYIKAYNMGERKNIGKVYRYYNYFPHWIYFGIFDKEYFNVIDLRKN
ncbi:MAG: PIG-L family deacetylase [Bacteroidetes bacterium]|nr:PIG-L family deacetylase [Bacteroidota bacterium]